MKHITAIIVLPVFNTEKYICDCLNSISNQTFDDFLCFIVDDGSKDNSGELINDFINKEGRNKFKFFSKVNGGVSSARNFALDKIYEYQLTPDYVFFIDSDDYIDHEYLSTMIDTANKYKCDYCACGYNEVSLRGIKVKFGFKEKEKLLIKSRIAEHFFSVGEYANPDSSSSLGIFNKCFRYDSIQNARFDENISIGEDMLFFSSVMPKMNAGVIISKNLYFYRLRKSSAMHKKDNVIRILLSSVKAFKKAIDINRQNPVYAEVIKTRLFIILYYALKKAVLLKAPEALYFYQELIAMARTYPALVPKSHVRQIKRLKLGYLSSILYFKLRNLTHKSKNHSKTSINNELNYFD